MEARRLLVITRNDLLREVEELYAGNAICEEAWRIRILKRGKGSLYNVYVSKKARDAPVVGWRLIFILQGPLPGPSRQS